MKMGRVAGLLALAMMAMSALVGQEPGPKHVDTFTGKPRVIILSDIGNEPDDQMSFVRLMLYSNELDLEAMIAVTSTWQRTATHAETMQSIVKAYGEARPSLMRNAKGWPEASELAQRIFTGQTAYGMAATGTDKMSAGAKAIVAAADRDDSRPLWICIWGGANTLAEALQWVRATRTPEQVAKLVAKLRVYSIGDQDDAGPWIRREFPQLFYIVSPSTPTSGEYLYATWTGISGDKYYRNGEGADFSEVTNEWLDRHIRKGPLGKWYPRYMFIMEGDTPSFLGLIDNGLNAYRRPDWGGWGGRYVYRQPYGEMHAIWTQGGDEFMRVTSQDAVMGVDGERHVSDQATIWRWRDAFQNDFAARMNWTVADFAHSNHNPLAVVDGKGGTAPIEMDVTVGEPVVLDASGSTDPDGQSLHFHWFHYAEAGFEDGNLSALTLKNADTARVTVTADAVCRPDWLPMVPCMGMGTAHVILAVTDDGSPQLTSYRRVILRVHPAAGRK
ncbi:MAG TPA: nucleoside hydrolase-like domain-containing protein [Terracidiphilus sp.]|nr:nucleoside hydrolase-like domain-containing protein [Terracidiphilus sp.]